MTQAATATATVTRLPNLRMPRERIGEHGAASIQIETLAVLLPCGYCGVEGGVPCHIMNPPFWDTRTHKTRMEPLWDLWLDGRAKGMVEAAGMAS